MTGLERLRELARGLEPSSVWWLTNKDYSDKHGLSSVNRGGFIDESLLDIADQIEREHLREVDDISGRDADAIAWVESHGGIAECDRKVEASMEVADKYTLLRMELGKLLGYDLMGQLDATDEELVEKIGKRLMPEGMEWPRFDTGEPVAFRDKGLDVYGHARNVEGVKFTQGGFVFISDHMGNTWWANDCGPMEAPKIDRSKRVKRPAPKVLDSEGVECNVGDDVWWVLNKTGDFRIIRIEANGKCAIRDDDADEPCGMTVPSSELTHKRPAFDADGVEIRAGDKLYSIETGDPVTVESVEPGNPWFATVSGELQFCGRFTHRAPVLAADGKPLREGETVYKVGGDGTAYVFDGMSDNVDGLAMLYHDGKPYIGTGLRVDQLTHERPDSWERLEEDARKGSCDYFGCDADGCDGCPAYSWNTARGGNGCGNAKMYDLVRRAKKLAGVS